MKKLLGLSLLIATSFQLSATVLEITNDADLNAVINNSELPVILDVYSPTCNPCQRMHPLFLAASNQYDGKVIFAKIQNKTASPKLASFNIRSVPTFLFFYKGKEVMSRMLGYKPQSVLNQNIDQLIDIANSQP